MNQPSVARISTRPCLVAVLLAGICCASWSTEAFGGGDGPADVVARAVNGVLDARRAIEKAHQKDIGPNQRDDFETQAEYQGRQQKADQKYADSLEKLFSDTARRCLTVDGIPVRYLRYQIDASPRYSEIALEIGRVPGTWKKGWNWDGLVQTSPYVDGISFSGASLTLLIPQEREQAKEWKAGRVERILARLHLSLQAALSESDRVLVFVEGVELYDSASGETLISARPRDLLSETEEKQYKGEGRGIGKTWCVKTGFNDYPCIPVDLGRHFKTSPSCGR